MLLLLIHLHLGYLLSLEPLAFNLAEAFVRDGSDLVLTFLSLLQVLFLSVCLRGYTCIHLGEE
jgi:hypothetical protein